ncbi:Clp protease ClpP [Cereibacter azotoformans]|uniref:head maturation protease, ClpP-related n=1 Tax=Cereibacter azotoformans TaxID=43057 RepID=UPI001EE9E396|nr:head maturation protease, ClpP-related [Cereibacter azotoformans]ULB09558.1 Clp protease ClpP [Cereibacter azotoformans]
MIAGAIGDGENTAKAIGQILEANPGPVTFIVNSPGGDAMEGAAICALLERHGQVTCYVAGLAASAASLAIMGASRIIMHRAAHLMIHEPSAITAGRAQELRDTADALDKIGRTYAEVYSRATGHPVERIAKWMADETWMTAEEALALRFCDEVDEEPAQARTVAAFDYTRFKAAPAQLLRLAKEKGWAAPSPALQQQGAD